MGTGCQLHLGVERTEGSSPPFPSPGPALPPLTPSLHSWSSLLSACGQTHPSSRPRSQQEPSRACTLDLGLLCHLPPTRPFPPLISGCWQKVDWKLALEGAVKAWEESAPQKEHSRRGWRGKQSGQRKPAKPGSPRPQTNGHLYKYKGDESDPPIKYHE